MVNYSIAASIFLLRHCIINFCRFLINTSRRSNVEAAIGALLYGPFHSQGLRGVPLGLGKIFETTLFMVFETRFKQAMIIIARSNLAMISSSLVQCIAKKYIKKI